ncbi:uncharacterized protein LOC123298433 [Chrysoperla carnea]|uniref:uncharacterized protein LOC123298433 n=1 Tax=Chrysoperla carnea TaxID=189513 RepID=UPI001D063745|nr:uncharacterized protein LOC123298433 [Chrysoperla carnea]
MEKKLDKVMDDILSHEGVTGCLFADQLGLCLGAKGNVSTAASGLIVVLAEIAGHLESNQSNSTNSRQPVISLESDNKKCLIQRNGNITGVIFKSDTVNA